LEIRMLATPTPETAGAYLHPDLFRGKTALVTGGGTGLGLEVSRALSALGAKVAIASRDPAHHADFLDATGAAGHVSRAEVLDVRDPRAVRRVVDRIADDWDGLDLLVNNAAGNFVRPALRLPPRAWQSVIDIALSGTFFCSQAAARVMTESGRGGAMVNIVAPYAWNGCPGVVHSAAAKAGVLALTTTLAVEWAELRVRVNAVAPGPFVSEGAGDRLWPSPEMAERVRGQIPAGRFGSAREVADAVLYLLSPAADFVNGACLTIDGGWCLGKGLFGEGEVVAVKRRRPGQSS
jgi:NAD(P)-dependent dehydrogenase (short-subunit alcohol dehydrogenase family)